MSCVPYGSQQMALGSGVAFAMPWMDELATKNKDLNADHRTVLLSLNSLLLALGSGDSMRISMACVALTSEVRSHFAMEEEMMQVSGYPERAAHIEQHQNLLSSISRIEFAMTAGSGNFSPASALSAIENWFVPHLTLADQRLADFISDCKARQTTN